jgi:hypothetical protein
MRDTLVLVFALAVGLSACNPHREPQANRVVDLYLHAAPLGQRNADAMKEDSSLQHVSFRGISGKVPNEVDGFAVYTLELQTPRGEDVPGRWERVRAVRLISASAASGELAEQRIRRIAAVPPVEGCAGLTAVFHVRDWKFPDGSGAAVVRPSRREDRALNTQLIVYDRNVDFTEYLPEYRPEPCNP